MLASLSIDLDPLALYHRIHGLPDPPAADPVYRLAAERFGDLCAALGVRGTVFCVGAALEDPGAAGSVRRLAGAGHEIASHGHDHDYALSRRPPGEIAADVRMADEAVARAAGRRPRGFRAPGYTLSAALLDALVAAGHRYDSSAFPALPYYIAKAAVLGALSLAGRRTAAVLDRPRVLAAPRVPYRPRAGEPYARGAMPILELPVTTGLLGFPIIGTFVGGWPEGVIRLLGAGTGRLPHFNLELHGLDMLDSSETPGALAARRFDLRVPAARKRARIERLVRRLGREWVTLEEAARRLGAGG